MLLALSAAVPAYAQSLWEHNGSVVRLHADGPTRHFYYDQPRPGLPIDRGALLFSGRKDASNYSGTAYLFSRTCGSIGYHVSGTVSEDQRVVTMYGRAPVRDRGCKVTGHRDDTLVFIHQSSPQPDTEQSFALTIADNATGLHIPVGYRGRTINVRMAQDEHFVFMLEDSLKDFGREPDILLLEHPRLRNAFASNWVNFDGKSVKIIVFDPLDLDHFRDRVPQSILDNANGVASLFQIAHEMGHHICDHLTDGKGSLPWKELEADRTAGAILARSRWRTFFGAGQYRQDIEAVMQATLSPQASSTHPGVADRIAAFRVGWITGRGCR